jgi:Icc-related predicted phosphoesterase
MDLSEINRWLEDNGWNLHARARELFPGVAALGVGCSPLTPFGTPSEYPDSRLAEWMEQALAEAGRAFSLPSPDQSGERIAPRLVLVSHTPPHACACDRLSNGTPVGSQAVRAFIEKHQPDVCLCGHIHEARAEDRIGATHVINPGTLAAGGYVVLSDHGDRLEAELKVL